MLFLLLSACQPSPASNAVTSGAADPVWDPASLPIVRLSFAEEDWQGTLEALVEEDDCAERLYHEADLTYENPQSGKTEIVTGVGVRYRGHSALETPNHSEGNRWGLKISFNEFSPGRRFHDLKKFVLLGTEGDGSLMRERLGLQMMTDAGVPAPRANYVRLYVNDEYQGLFPHIEEADDNPFLEHHFGDDTGSLYKVAGYCHGTHMEWEGLDIADYDGFESVADTLDADKVADLIPLFQCLAPGSDDAAFRTCIEQWIDVDEWLTEMAVDMLLPNIDGMAATAQNFLIYRPPATGRFVVYPYDLDLSFYGNEESYASTSIFGLTPTWESTLPVLPARLRTVYAAEYCARVLEVAEQFAPDVIEPRIRALATFLEPDIVSDPFIEPGAWGWAVDDVVEVVTARHPAVVAEAQACDPGVGGTGP